MNITWLGHACFRLETNGGTLILDPYKNGSVPGLADLHEQADCVLCSHEHGDHAGREQVQLTGAPLKGVTVTALPSFHDDAKGTLRGTNTIHLIEDGETRVAHLGDLGCALTQEQTAALTGLDVVFVPVGGFFTIDGAQAAALMETLRPKVIVPMHYRSAGFGYEVIGTVEQFTDRMPTVTVLHGSSFDTADSPAGVVVLQPLAAL